MAFSGKMTRGGLSYQAERFSKARKNCTMRTSFPQNFRESLYLREWQYILRSAPCLPWGKERCSLGSAALARPFPMRVGRSFEYGGKDR